MAKSFSREYRFELSTLLFAIGLLATFIASIGIFIGTLPAYLLPFQPAIKAFGNWIYCLWS
jgi:hypothetical protein